MERNAFDDQQRYGLVRMYKPNFPSDVDAELGLLFEIDSAWPARLAEALRSLNTFRAENLISVVEDNFDALRDLYSHIYDVAETKGSQTDREAQHLLKRKSVATVFNLVSSVWLYQEHLEVREARENGKEAKATLHRRFGAAYDSCPELFLLWKLRSVMMHDNFTFLAYRYGTRPLDDTDAMESFAHLSLNLTNLRLIEGFRTQSPLTDMLERRADDQGRIEFIHVARTGLEALLELHHDLTAGTHPDLITDARTVTEFHDTYLSDILDQRNIFITQLDDQGLPRPTNLIVLSPGDFTHARTLIDATPSADQPDT